MLRQFANINRRLSSFLTPELSQVFLLSISKALANQRLPIHYSIIAETADDIQFALKNKLAIELDLANTMSSPEFREMSKSDQDEWTRIAASEVALTEMRVSRGWKNIRNLLLGTLVKDGVFNDDVLDCRLEVTQGAGGAEAAAFANELFASYELFAGSNGFQWDPIDSQSAKIQARNSSRSRDWELGPYGWFRYEHGIHRMQRFPTVIQTKDKPQTIAASVAVMPIRPTDNIEIKPADLILIQQRSCAGAGGQGLQAANQAIRLKHVPTGLEVFCADSRSHLDNRKLAYERLKEKIAELVAEQKEAKLLDSKRSAFGSGKWAEKIRAYNDHRDEIVDVRMDGKFSGMHEMFETGGFGDLVTQLRERRENELLEHATKKLIDECEGK